MLQQKYIPEFHFSESHSVKVNAAPQKIFSLLDEIDFRESWVIRMLFSMRGLGSQTSNPRQLLNGHFILLEQIENSEIAYGLLGQFWKPSGNLVKSSREQFVSFAMPDFLKAVWSFSLVPVGEQTTLVRTETRVYATSEKSKRKFSPYWFIIRPFSGLIRKEILRLIKKRAEQLPPTSVSIS
jgi:hypothetical protein